MPKTQRIPKNAGLNSSSDLPPEALSGGTPSPKTKELKLDAVKDGGCLGIGEMATSYDVCWNRYTLHLRRLGDISKRLETVLLIIDEERGGEAGKNWGRSLKMDIEELSADNIEIRDEANTLKPRKERGGRGSTHFASVVGALRYLSYNARRVHSLNITDAQRGELAESLQRVSRGLARILPKIPEFRKGKLAVALAGRDVLHFAEESLGAELELGEISSLTGDDGNLVNNGWY